MCSHTLILYKGPVHLHPPLPFSVLNIFRTSVLHVGVLLGHNLAPMQLTQASVGAMDVGMM